MHWAPTVTVSQRTERMLGFDLCCNKSTVAKEIRQRVRETGSEKQERPSPGCPSTWDSSVGDGKGFHSRDGKRKKMRGEQWENEKLRASEQGKCNRDCAKEIKTQEAIHCWQIQQLRAPLYPEVHHALLLWAKRSKPNSKSDIRFLHINGSTRGQQTNTNFCWSCSSNCMHAAVAQNMIKTYRIEGICKC